MAGTPSVLEYARPVEGVVGAGADRRVIAVVIDAVTAYAVATLAVAALDAAGMARDPRSLPLWIAALWGAALFFFDVLGGPGRRVARLKVVEDRTGRRAQIGRRAVRALVATPVVPMGMLPALTMSAGGGLASAYATLATLVLYLAVLIADTVLVLIGRRRRVADRVSGTVVVKAGRGGAHAADASRTSTGG